MTKAIELDRTRSRLRRATRLETIASTLDRDDARRAELMDVAKETVDDVDPVRVSVAADILHVTEKTVRAWADQGVLDVVIVEPRVLIDPSSLHVVSRLVDDLRAAGKTRGLLDEVYWRLTDRSLLEDADLLESLEQMRRGEYRVVRSGSGGSSKMS